MAAKMRNRRNTRRRGAAAVLTAVSSTVLIGFTALTVDVGILYNYKAEMQRSADSAALAGTAALLSTDRLKGLADYTGELTAARTAATQFAALNPVVKTTPTLLSSDIVPGYLYNPDNLTEALSVPSPARYNSVQVTVKRDSTHNGAIDLWFARIFGIQSTTMHATATATYKDGINGFKVTGTSGNAGLLPFALKVTDWNNLLAGISSVGDTFNYNTSTKTVSSGSDGILEVKLFPSSNTGQGNGNSGNSNGSNGNGNGNSGSGNSGNGNGNGSGSSSSSLTPGNFGTVDIGSSNNSTADLSRQIRYGVNQSDLAYFGGEFKLGSNGTINVNGDTGISAGIQDDLVSIIGKPRTILLYSTVVSPGNNSIFTVVGFAGIRIVDVDLTHSETSKKVIIQPAFAVDPTAQAGSNPGTSTFVYQPIRLTR